MSCPFVSATPVLTELVESWLPSAISEVALEATRSGGYEHLLAPGSPLTTGSLADAMYNCSFFVRDMLADRMHDALCNAGWVSTDRAVWLRASDFVASRLTHLPTLAARLTDNPMSDDYVAFDESL